MQANPLVTPPDIVPEWYLLPFYAMLRSIPNKLMGVIVMGGAIVTLVFIPWLDTSRVRSCRFRPLMKQFFWAFAVVCVHPGLLRLAERGCGALVGIPLVWVARLGDDLLLRLLLADHADRRADRDAQEASRLHCPIRARRYRRGRLPSETPPCALPFALTLAAGLRGCWRCRRSALAAMDTTRMPVKDVDFSFEGPFGTYDRGALQRGFQVYKEVCAACHSLDHIAFHNLDEEGGPDFTEAQAKAIAAGYKMPADPNDKGEIFDDKGTPPDPSRHPGRQFPAAFPERGSGPRQQWRCAAARSVDDREGARRRRRNMSIPSSPAST